MHATVLQHILPFLPAKPCWQEATLRPSEETINPCCSTSNSVSGLKWLPKVILCCRERSGGKTFRNDCVFPIAVFQHNEVMEPLMNLTLNIGMFCLSWIFSSCSWSLLSNWTSGDPYFPGDLLLEFLPDTNILLFPVFFCPFTKDFFCPLSPPFLIASKSTRSYLVFQPELLLYF